MTGQFTVRFATDGDLSFVARDGYVPLETVRLKIGRREVFVAEAGEVPVGYLRLEYLWSKVPYVALISVLPGYRRAGVGRAILGFVEEFLRAEGHEALYSSSQSDEPEPQAWHRSAGFEECGIIAGINEGGIGEVFFRKRLA